MNVAKIIPLEYDGKRVAITSMLAEYIFDKEPGGNTLNRIAVNIAMNTRRGLVENTDFYSLTSGEGLQDFKAKYPHLPTTASRFLLYAKSGVKKLAEVPRLACLKDFAKEYFVKAETPNLFYFDDKGEPAELKVDKVVFPVKKIAEIKSGGQNVVAKCIVNGKVGSVVNVMEVSIGKYYILAFTLTDDTGDIKCKQIFGDKDAAVALHDEMKVGDTVKVEGKYFYDEVTCNFVLKADKIDIVAKAEVKVDEVADEVVADEVDEVDDKSLTIFENEQFGTIRTAGTADNPLFCLADLCKALELIPSKVAQRLEKDVLSKYTLQTAGGLQEMNFVNEDGLYDVILDSRKPEAKKFRKWITSEVLPSIRKTGEYKVPVKKKSVTVKPSEMVKEVAALAKVYSKEFNVKPQMALARAVNEVGKFFEYDVYSLTVGMLPPAEPGTGTMNATRLGAKVGMTARKVNQKLAELGLQVKENDVWRLTAEGEKHADSFIFEANGHQDTQIRWRDSVIELLEA